MNPITQNIEPKPSARCRKAVAGCFLEAILAVLLLAIATQGPVLAQTTNAVDDGTTLKQSSSLAAIASAPPQVTQTA